MTRLRWTRLSVVVGVAAALLGGRVVHAQDMLQEAELPAPVAKTFRAKFPKAEIQKLTAEEEGGVMVYDFEFKDGDVERETDIAAEGTMLEITLVITTEDLPAAALESIKKHAKEAELGRIEKIDISWEIDEGKIVALEAIETRYAAEMSKGKKRAEVIVRPDGKVVEAPEWVEVEAKPKGEVK